MVSGKPDPLFCEGKRGGPAKNKNGPFASHPPHLVLQRGANVNHGQIERNLASQKI